MVPSTEFEQKRRQINKHLLEEIEKDEEPVLCGKKKKKKKKKKKNKDEEQEDSIMVSLSFLEFAIFLMHFNYKCSIFSLYLALTFEMKQIGIFESP